MDKVTNIDLAGKKLDVEMASDVVGGGTGWVDKDNDTFLSGWLLGRKQCSMCTNEKEGKFYYNVSNGIHYMICEECYNELKTNQSNT